MEKRDHIDLIIKECLQQGINDPNQIAYVLATVQHETAGTYRPIDEIGARNARYAPYYGRGYVQLTWESNYRKYSELLGRDFVANPDWVKEPKTAAFILVHGFKNGTFTGRRIGQYINATRCDFTSARRCINGTDRAALIASHARKWLERLPEFMPTKLKGGKAVLRIAEDTHLKQSTVQSVELPDNQKVAMQEGKELPLLAYLEVNNQHVRITLNGQLLGFNTWYAYLPHVAIVEAS